MGTNYYVVQKCPAPCAHCMHENKTHLGKASIGWVFLFRADPAWAPEEAFVRWCELARSGQIVTEYGSPITFHGLMTHVVYTSTGKRRHPRVAYVTASGSQFETEPFF